MRLPSALLAPTGLAGAIVLAMPLTRADATAELITPAVVCAGIAGLALLPARRRRLDWLALGCGAAALAAYAAPFALTGAPTLGGYVSLDDTASWLAIADWVGRHGVEVSGLPPSTYETMLDFYLGSAYPVGGLLPLVLGARLVATDLAWLYQPYLALLAAMLALSLYAVAERAIPSPRLRALAAFIAAQPAILFGYVLWGGFKEAAGAGLIALLAALVAPTLETGQGVRGALPLAVGASATLAVLSAGGAVWLLPLLAAGLVAAIRTVGRDRALRLAATVAAMGLVLSIPALLDVRFLDSAAAATVTNAGRLANLFHPLSVLQVLGVWPAGDFRLRPEDPAQTYVLVAVVGLAAAGGVVAAWRSRNATLLIYVAATCIGGAVIVALGSAWVDAKALATASPALVLCAFAGAAAVLRTGRRAEAAAIVAAIAGGVLWSNALAYRDVSLAPHDRFDELRRIGHRIAGAGPTLMTDYEPYGARYFLRDGDPEGASELRRRLIRLRGGGLLPKGESADIDAFELPSVLVYRTLVLRRSPLASRPPAPYELTWSGRYYDVWQRAPTPAAVLEHLPLGGADSPAAIPRCGDVLRLARRVPSGGHVAAALVGDPIVLALGAGATQTLEVRLTLGGRYEVWLAGSCQGRVDLSIDGERVASARWEHGYGTPLVPLAERRMAAGSHRLELRYGGADAHPGSGAPAELRSLVLAATGPRRSMVYVKPSAARSLCGRRLDWLEALGGRAVRRSA